MKFEWKILFDQLKKVHSIQFSLERISFIKIKSLQTMHLTHSIEGKKKMKTYEKQQFYNS